MIDECQVTLTGYVATQPEIKTFESGASNVSMRVAWTERRRDRITGDWVDGTTSYATVICWRKLGTNVALSLRTGDPVVVKGKLVVRTFEDREGVRRNKVEVDVSSIGHDLNRGVSDFMRVRPKTGMTAAEYDSAKAAGQLPSSAADGAASADGDGRAGPGAAAGDSAGLRFTGGLESAAEDGLPALADLPVPDEPEGWAGEADDTDLGGETPLAADGRGERAAEVGSGSGSEADAGADAEAEMAAAVL
jgi:single-strand DNA-binding protein